MNPSGESARRPLKSRSTAWARMAASRLTRAGVSPNAISLASVIFAALGSALLVYSPEFGAAWWLGWIGVALCVQARLLCNLMDGMVAVEGNRRSPTGELWNEVPDRIADTLFLLAAAFAVGSTVLGVLAVTGALMTAYVRALGATLTGEQDFCGPMAKPHRMAALTASLILGVLLGPWLGAERVLLIGVIVIALGSWATVARRLFRLATKLRERSE